MDLRPHLSFLPPKRVSRIDPLPGGGSGLTTPSPSAQFTRFKPKISEMKTHFAEHIVLCESVEGMSPEKILVLELAGSVQNFATALQKVEGFEYLTRWLTDDIVEEGSVYSRDKQKPVEREIYLTMSNQEGLNKLFAQWKKASETGSADYAPLRHALCQLHNIRFWDTEDRVKKTGLLEDWEYRLSDVEHYGSEQVPFEIELWFKSSPRARAFAEEALRKLINTSGGTTSGSFMHTGIAYHALRGELPIEKVRLVVENGGEHLQLMRSDEVMFFRPLGQCGFSLLNEEIDSFVEEEEPLENPSIEPSEAIVALFDGLPLENHQAIKNRILIDDPDNYSELYSSPREQLHGTAMASLIIHGDKSADDQPINSPLYVRPVLAPGRPDINNNRLENIPDGVLPLDLIHRSVKRLFEGEGDDAPAAPNIKAINLSVCDPRQLFDRNMSAWARMLDWLSCRYEVLFIVSAGNHLDDIQLDINNEVFLSLTDEEKEKTIIETINNDRWSRRLMSPAESVNAITVKASHHDYSEAKSINGIFDPFVTDGMFSPINPITLGKANGIKPEVMASGGRVTYRNTSFLDKDLVKLSVVNTPKSFGPGNKVAVPGNNLGSINSYAFSYGTSNAAAIITRRVAMLHETIVSMKEFQQESNLENAPESLILKALIVHGTELPLKAAKACKDVLLTDENRKTYKNNQGQYFGYGQINEQRIHACRPNQATLICTGEVELGGAEVYEFPLPACLASSQENRRMVITLAWFSPINPIHNEYHEAQMWVSDPKKSSPLSFDQGDYYHHHQKKGTVYHEVVHGHKASPYLEGGTVPLKINCKTRADGVEGTTKIPYALVVTLDTENIELPVYAEVKALLEQKIEQNVSGKIELSSSQ